MPVGAYAASKEIMSQISPDGPVYQAGTLSGNPVAMMAGYAALKEVLKPGFFEGQKSRTEYFVNAVVDYAKSKGYNFSIYTVGSIFWLAFSENIQIRKASEIDADSMQYFKRLHAALLERGVYVGPSGFEVGFISEAHTKEYLDIAIKAFKESLDIAFE